MLEIITVINSLPNVLALTPASKIEVSDAEIQLCLQFSDEYKEYLGKFGAIIADGVDLTGITKSEYKNVVFVTNQEWKLNPKVPHSLYVVENMGIDGIIVWQDNSGTVFQTTPNSEPIKISESLVQYLKK